MLTSSEFALRTPHSVLRVLKLVVREGSAPSTAGCRPAVMLFHYRTLKTRGAERGARNEPRVCVRSGPSVPRSEFRVPHVPENIGTPGRNLTRISDVRSVALYD